MNISQVVFKFHDSNNSFTLDVNENNGLPYIVLTDKETLTRYDIVRNESNQLEITFCSSNI